MTLAKHGGHGIDDSVESLRNRNCPKRRWTFRLSRAGEGQSLVDDVSEPARLSVYDFSIVASQFNVVHIAALEVVRGYPQRCQWCSQFMRYAGGDYRLHTS